MDEKRREKAGKKGMAETKGFEPLRGVNPNTLSRRAP